MTLLRHFPKHLRCMPNIYAKLVGQLKLNWQRRLGRPLPAKTVQCNSSRVRCAVSMQPKDSMENDSNNNLVSILTYSQHVSYNSKNHFFAFSFLKKNMLFSSLLTKRLVSVASAI